LARSDSDCPQMVLWFSGYGAVPHPSPLSPGIFRTIYRSL
jgi:hypothetical protein